MDIRKSGLIILKLFAFLWPNLICIAVAWSQTSRDLADSNPGCEKIYVAVEQMPQFPDGMPGLLRFIKKNLKYPAKATEAKIDTAVTVRIRFFIRTDGQAEVLQVENDPGYGFKEEALRVISLMPRWQPGMINGEAVCVRGTIPLMFYPGQPSGIEQMGCNIASGGPPHRRTACGFVYRPLSRGINRNINIFCFGYVEALFVPDSFYPDNGFWSCPDQV